MLARRLRPSARKRLRLALLVCAVLACLSIARWSASLSSGSGPAPYICLVGNAETDDKALAVYTQWDGAFPAAFYVWGERWTDGETRSRAETRRVTLLRPMEGERALPFADGMFAAVNEITSRQRCDYIFSASGSPSSPLFARSRLLSPAHDDDLEFRLAPLATYYDPAAPRSNLAAELQYILDVYRPAIAGFPWQVGDERFEGMRALKEEYETEEVAPLTGFDNGMVVYHKSVLPLFFVRRRSSILLPARR